MSNLEKDRKQLFILSLVGSAICLLMFIPFGTNFTFIEQLVKFVILPVVVALLNLLVTFTKFREYRPTNKFLSFVSYAPIFTYYISAFVYLVFVINRANPTAIFSYTNYILAMVIIGALIACGIVALLIMDRINLKLSKNQVNILDVALYIGLVIDVIIMSSVILKPLSLVTLDNSSIGNIVLGIVVGIVIVGSICYKVYKSYATNEEFVVRDKQELIDKFENQKELEHSKAELLILHALHNYSNERYVVEDTPVENNVNATLVEGTVAVDSNELDNLINEVKVLKHNNKQDEIKHNKLKADYIALQNELKLHVAKTELEGLNKQSDLLDASIKEETTRVNDDIDQYNVDKQQFDEKVSQLEKEKVEHLQKLGFDSIEAVLADEQAKLEAKALAKERAQKPEKVIVPSFKEMLDLANSIKGEDISVVTNPNGTQYKYMVGKKPFLLMQKTSSDYRVTFCAKNDDIVTYLQSYPGVIEVAKSPKGGNFLKVTNSGELDAELLNKVITGSLEAELESERLVAEAKEAEVQAKLAQKEEEKRQRALLKEAERIVAKAKREEEKAQLKAQKEAEKQALKEQKEALDEAA